MNRFFLPPLEINLSLLITRDESVCVCVCVCERERVWVCVRVCVYVRVFVTYEDTNLYNDMGMT